MALKNGTLPEDSLKFTKDFQFYAYLAGKNVDDATAYTDYDQVLALDLSPEIRENVELLKEQSSMYTNNNLDTIEANNIVGDTGHFKHVDL